MLSVLPQLEFKLKVIFPMYFIYNLFLIFYIITVQVTTVITFVSTKADCNESYANVVIFVSYLNRLGFRGGGG